MQSKVGVKDQVRRIRRQEVGELHLVTVDAAVYKLKISECVLKSGKQQFSLSNPLMYPEVKSIHLLS